ncbi:MAG: hypothetical protein FE041_01190 [Thermoplasmata archaeon]|nr:MAG: hypothetical protein FE041_01190 [Thermoplasmata archaeon]
MDFEYHFWENKLFYMEIDFNFMSLVIKELGPFLIICLMLSSMLTESNAPVFQEKEQMRLPVISFEESSADTEYWALLVAVGVYANVPEMNRPSMLKEVENLYKTLLVSEWWDENHIKVITAENATLLNIIKGFRWLDKMEDENDICLIYLTTHGFPIIFDLPPFDEKDEMDEALATYRGFLPFENPWSWEPLANPFAILTDDEINYFLNRLESKGICLIVDSCHSGGFNDNWSYAKKFAKELSVELRGKNRVVMTSVREEDTSYGSFFTHYLVEGLKGYGDKNGDGICSAEEAFWYAQPIIEKYYGMYPQIFDDYPGELYLTEVELPPSEPTISGNETGKINVLQTYQLYSEDPEEDRIRYFIDWGDGSTEWSKLYESGEVISVSHSWNKEGTYVIKVIAEDEKGAESDTASFTVSMAEKIVDQRQVNGYYAYIINNTRWLAQSFIPSISNLSKIELGLIAWKENFEVTISLRESLNGSDLMTFSLTIPVSKEWETEWIMFDFPDIKVVPRKEYYIVCRSNNADWGVVWVVGIKNPYPYGSFYHSGDAGVSWERESMLDACFVTYG